MTEVINNKINQTEPQSKSFQEQIIAYKNEILKDFKQIEEQISNKNEYNFTFFSNKIKKLESSFEEINKQFQQISSFTILNKSLPETVNNLSFSTSKIKETLKNNENEIKNIQKKLDSSFEKYDNVIMQSLLYPGLIGKNAKFENFHELIDYVLFNINNFLTFKDLNLTKINEKRKNLENSMKDFQTKIDFWMKSSSKFTEKILKVCENNFQTILNKQMIEVKNTLNDLCDSKNKNFFSDIKNQLDKYDKLQIKLSEHIDEYSIMSNDVNYLKIAVNQLKNRIKHHHTKIESKEEPINSKLKKYIDGTIKLDDLVPDKRKKSTDLIQNKKSDDIINTLNSKNSEDEINEINEIKNKSLNNDNNNLTTRRSYVLSNQNSLINSAGGISIYNNYKNALSNKNCSLGSKKNNINKSFFRSGSYNKKEFIKNSTFNELNEPNLKNFSDFDFKILKDSSEFNGENNKKTIFQIKNNINNSVKFLNKGNSKKLQNSESSFSDNIINENSKISKNENINKNNQYNNIKQFSNKKNENSILNNIKFLEKEKNKNITNLENKFLLEKNQNNSMSMFNNKKLQSAIGTQKKSLMSPKSLKNQNKENIFDKVINDKNISLNKSNWDSNKNWNKKTVNKNREIRSPGGKGVLIGGKLKYDKKKIFIYNKQSVSPVKKDIDMENNYYFNLMKKLDNK